VVGLSMPVRLSASFVTPWRCGSTPHQVPRPPRGNACRLYHHAGLGCAPFARRYSGHHCCFLFLGVLRCFSSPGSRPLPYVFRQRRHGMTRARFAHSEIRGSTLAWQLPAAYRSLQRPSSASSAKASTGCPLKLAETMLALAMKFTRTDTGHPGAYPDNPGRSTVNRQKERAIASLKTAQCAHHTHRRPPNRS
jgi:hypothetical protein